MPEYRHLLAVYHLVGYTGVIRVDLKTVLFLHQSVQRLGQLNIQRSLPLLIVINVLTVELEVEYYQQLSHFPFQLL